MDCHFFLQGIFLTEGQKSCLLYLLHCRWILYQLSYHRSPQYKFRLIVIEKRYKFSPLVSQITFQLLNSHLWLQFSSVQSLSRVWLFVTPWTAARQASLSITNSQSLSKLKSTESVIPSSHLIFCHPLLLLPPIPPSIRVFYNESTLRMRWPKY